MTAARVKTALLVMILMLSWTGASAQTQSPLMVAQSVAATAESGPEGLTAVIYPYRSATIGTEVRGTIDLINFKEGELVKEGAVVAEVSKDRYTAVVGEFQGNYQAIERSLVKAREDLSVQEELHNRRAGNWSDLVRARSDVAILEARKEEAAFKLRQAELNLKACIIKAPFSGTIAVFYHEPFETVDNLEKIFNVIDIDKVYARVNWPEARVDELTPGRRAVFVYQGKEYEGVLEKVSPLIDPAPKAKRVHVVLNNPGGKLQVGMSGSLRFKEGSKLSQRSDE